MIKTITELIMKHPIASILTILALTIPYPLALLVYKHHTSLSLGSYGFMAVGIMLSAIQVSLWWVVSWLSTQILHSKTKDKFYKKNKDSLAYNIAIGSFVSGLYCLFVLFLSYYILKLNLKWFLVLTYLLVFVRLMITGIEFLYNFRKEFK